MVEVAIQQTICICTDRGLSMLAMTLPRLRDALVLDRRTEILIVSNRTDDDTSVLRDFLTRTFHGTRITSSVIHEGRRGLSHARNAALAAARGSIVTFLDDDAAPRDREWQRAVLTAFARDDRIAAVGGPVALVPPAGASTRLLSPRVERLLSCGGLQSVSRPCRFGAILGVNASYRRTCVGDLRFDPRIGWNSARRSALAGEEAVFNWQLQRQGCTLWFEQGAVVEHFIAPKRWRIPWLLARAYVDGKTAALLQSNGVDASFCRVSAARLFARGCAKLMVRSGQLLAGIALARTAIAVSHLCDMAAAVGQMEMALSLRSRKRLRLL